MKWFVGEALYREGGMWRPTRSDRILRTMRVHTGGDTVYVDVRGSRKASELGAYHAAVRQFLSTGDESVLSKFRSRSVAGKPYEVDPEVLEEMARRGHLDLDTIYRVAGV
jgi:hypothetical protein